jgi:hypothetical protein
MRTVHKYKYTDGMTLELPTQAYVVHVGTDPKGLLCLWIETELTDELNLANELSNELLFPRHYKTFGTGHNLPEEAMFIGTYIDSPFVWHIYEVQ